MVKLKRLRKQKKAVSPVLATLLMVAVAVAMSVIIFTWSQGFLSQTGEAAAAQQAAQNVAAQSGIFIETATFTTDNDDNWDDSMTIYVRNIGTVSVKVADIYVTGPTTNAGFKGSSVISVDTVLQRGSDTSGSLSNVLLKSGDVITVKATTSVGTFAQATFTVP